MARVIELIDWSEQYPHENSLQIAIRQSAFCPCGRMKEIGKANCGGPAHLESEQEKAQPPMPAG